MGGIVFGWINDRLKEAQSDLIDFLQVILLIRPSSGDSVAERLLYGLSWGYADRLAVYAAILLIFMALAMRGYFENLVHAFITVLVVGSLGGFWFVILEFIGQTERWLSQKAMWYDGKGGKDGGIFDVLAIDNVFVSVLALLGTAAMCLAIAVIFAFLDVAAIGAIASFLPSVALAPIGNGFKKFRNAMLAIIILARLFGRPVAHFLLDLGQYAKDNLPWGDSGFGSYILNIATMVLLIFSLWLIGKSAYNAPAWVVGRIRSKATVSGNVQASLKPGQKVAATTVRQEINRAVPMNATHTASVNVNRSTNQTIRDNIVDRASTATKTALIVKTGGLSHAVVSPVVDKTAQRLKTKPTTPPPT